MLRICLLISFACVLFAQPKAPPLPPLAACGMQGDVEVLCGARSPEDLELTPDGRFLLVAQFVSPANGPGGGIVMFDIAKKTYAPATVTVEPLGNWGDANCPGPPMAVHAHGTSLVKNSRGQQQLYVVNHAGRESIEMYELKKSGEAWSLVWHGCVVAMHEFNDVAALADGSFVATHPLALRQQGQDLFAGAPTGYAIHWVRGSGETELPGTRFGYPNGIVVSADGKTAYYAAWTVKEIHKYDLRAKKEVGVLKLDFMPDNLTWTKKNQLLAAGVKGTRGECPAGSGRPCIQGFGVAEIDPGKFVAKTHFDSDGKPALIGGVSVALEVNGNVYVGAFQGDRLVKYKR